MLFTKTIFNKFINIWDDIDNITNNLILKTVEVEEVVHRTIPETVVIGKIKEISKHPDADKLNVCILDCWKHWEYTIVCGWENVAPDMFVCTALPETYLPAIDLKIQWRAVRWIESNWMICAKAELWINEDTDLHTIRDLSEDFEDLSSDDIWVSFIEKFSRLNNTIIDVDNKWLTHRPDLTWHFWLATELNAIYYSKDKSKIKFNKIKEYYEQFSNKDINQILENSKKSNKKVLSETDKLNTYILMEINNISVLKSEFFTRLQMLDLWQTPINNRVDFSNIFMNTVWQPIHFFDADKVEWNIIVRNAKTGEKFTDLFEKEHELLESDIVIADEKKILALAGVVWGLESWVTDSTENIILEIANFDAVSVRKTWVRLGLRTDAELRFEKNINPVFSLYTLILFLDLIKFYSKDLWTYEIWWLSFFIKDWVLDLQHKSLSIDLQECSNFVFGEDKTSEYEQFTMILKWLWYKTNIIDGKWTVEFPVRRSPDDMNIKQDVFEEVARIYWYENVEEKQVSTPVNTDDFLPSVKLNRTLEELLTMQLQFSQVETYPRIWEKELSAFNQDNSELMEIKNPINVDQPYLRDSIIYPLMDYVKKNSKFFDKIKMFDIGKVWSQWDTTNKDLANVENIEKHSLSQINEKSVLWLVDYQKSISTRENDNLLSMKWYIQTLLATLWIKGKLEYVKTDLPSFHPKKQWKILLNRQEIGFVGTIHPLVNTQYKINEKSSVVFSQIDLNLLLPFFENAKIKTNYETLQDQIVWRDLCFVIDEKDSFDPILTAINKTKWVEELAVFDLYKGENLEPWKKSIAIKFKIKWENMTTEEINTIMDQAISNVEKTWAKLR